ncbi:adenine methyltransferase [Alkalicoccobacillus porphyridii]|uniref:Adenine methyltransferase n=2 Tax=Alkalicoccobacillus porphyridii TaxID=2597270 RepID=A0A554A0G1_9BACI|nr:adenine methyltransferase [Alkalicoccobacillus porphyridii]
MGGHHSSAMGKDEWLTPPEIVESLGMFDLDPCAPIDRPWNTANKHLSILDNGLNTDWSGRVWLNPPYGRETTKWLDKLADHGNGIALIFARTETEMFFNHVWNKADALLFFKGRLHFYHVDGVRAKANAGAPSVLIAYGENNVATLKKVEQWGKLIDLRMTSNLQKEDEHCLTKVTGC